MRINDTYQNNLTVYSKQTTVNGFILPGLPEESVEAQQAEELLEDSVTISKDGRQKAKDTKAEQARIEREKEELQKQLEIARQQGEAVAAELKTRMKCLMIASRILSGDEVPPDDYRYLAKNDLDLYSKAVSMRIEKEKPVKHKRLSEDEESTGDAASTDGVSEAGATGGDSESAEVAVEASDESSAGSEPEQSSK